MLLKVERSHETRECEPRLALYANGRMGLQLLEPIYHVGAVGLDAFTRSLCTIKHLAGIRKDTHVVRLELVVGSDLAPPLARFLAQVNRSALLSGHFPAFLVGI